MRLLDLLAYWLCWLTFASAQSSTPLPSCALVCLGQELPFSGCALTDFACQCSSRNLTVSTAACMLANCTMADTLALAKFQANLCKAPIQDRSQVIVIVFIVISAVVSVLVFLRFVSGNLRGNKLGLEDWIIAGALILAVTSDCAYFSQWSHPVASEGFGKHLYSLSDGDLLRFLKEFYIAENIYVVVLALTKVSILTFYLRIFQNQAHFRSAVWTTMVFIFLSTTIISVLTIFSCQPVAYFWNRDIKGGVCLDVNALAYANSAMSMAQDIIITILPVKEVFGLNMNLQKKIGVAGMFALGGFGCIVSGIRLRVLLGFGNSIDPTWDYVFVVIWTAIELGVAIALSCLPAVRLLIIRVFAKLPHSSIGSSSRSRTPNSSGKDGRKGWMGKNKDFVELSEHDQAMTHITVNGEDFEYPRRPPAVPFKGGP